MLPISSEKPDGGRAHGQGSRPGLYWQGDVCWQRPIEEAGGQHLKSIGGSVAYFLMPDGSGIAIQSGPTERQRSC